MVYESDLQLDIYFLLVIKLEITKLLQHSQESLRTVFVNFLIEVSLMRFKSFVASFECDAALV